MGDYIKENGNLVKIAGMPSGSGGSGGTDLTVGNFGYSEEEQCVGCYIDGKPIYRKVIKGKTSATNGANASINVSELNIDFFNLIAGILDDGTGAYYAYPAYANAVNAGSRLHYNKNDGNIYIFNNFATWVNKNVTITLEYTKTTDEPNSFTLDMLTTGTVSDIVSEDDINEIIGEL